VIGSRKNPWRAARLDARGRVHRAVGTDLEQRRHCIGGALAKLLSRRRVQAGEAVEGRRAPREVTTVRSPTLALGAVPGSTIVSSAAGRFVVGGLGEAARDFEVRARPPEVDKDVHDTAAGADLLLVEVAGQVDLSQPGLAVIFK